MLKTPIKVAVADELSRYMNWLMTEAIRKRQI